MAKPINKQHSKTVHRLFTSMIGLQGVTLAASGTDMNITAAISGALGTASWHGTAVPMQKSTDVDTEGVRIAANQKLVITGVDDDTPLVDSSGAEIYGVLAESAGVFTLEFKTFTGGVAAAATLPAADYNFEVPYLFKLEDVPVDFAGGGNASRVGDDPKGGGRIVREIVAVTAANVVADLSFLPISGTVSLNVDGHVVEELRTAFSMTAKAITWVAANAYDLETTDIIVATYATYE